MAQTDRYQAADTLSGWQIIDTATWIASVVRREIADGEIDSAVKSMNTRNARTSNHIVHITRRDGSEVIYAEGGLSKNEAIAKLAEAAEQPDTYSARVTRNAVTVKI